MIGPGPCRPTPAATVSSSSMESSRFAKSSFVEGLILSLLCGWCDIVRNVGRMSSTSIDGCDWCHVVATVHADVVSVRGAIRIMVRIRCALFQGKAAVKKAQLPDCEVRELCPARAGCAGFR